MLTHIHIRDFVIVETLELEIGPGMTVLTGETGAGKSILVDALGLALGERADTGLIRHGCERAEVAASFDLSALPEVEGWLEEQDLAADGECHLRRVIGREGRSRAWINGRPVPVQQLRALGGRLVDIHGQHEHQSLLRREVQRELLDAHAGHLDQVTELGAKYAAWKARREELESLREAARDRDARLELLRFHLEELEALAPEEGELAALETEHARLANAGRLLESCGQALAALEEDEVNAQALLAQAVSSIESLVAVDPGLGEALELLNGAMIQLQEGSDALRRHADRLELDPARLAWLDERISSLQQLARKHRVDPEALPRVLAETRAEIERLDQSEQLHDSLEAEIAALAEDYRKLATDIGRGRRKAARTLGQAISEAMQALGMPGGRFEVAVEALDDGGFRPHGLDRVEFLVSANPGSPPAPLGKAASGGELSRIALAIQVMARGAGLPPVLVFDEVDTGIGGPTAEVVGQKLRSLGGQAQVLCVTHLPQVAAQAHHHLQVSKLAGTDSTRTRIRALSDEERVEEIARMLGGLEVTDSTLEHARDMLARAGGPPKRRRKKK